MNNRINRILFHIIDFIFLILSYVLCDYLVLKYDATLGIILGLIFYMTVTVILHKIFKVDM